jgi:lipopolysaccharide export system permease protein
MTLFRSTFTELIFPFFLTFGVMTCILLMQRIYTLVSLMVEKKFALQEVSLMLFYLLPQILTIAIPLGVVGAVFITVIRQSVDSELVCPRTTGTSLWVYSLPILLFGLLATAVTSFNSLWLSPYLYEKYAVLEAEIIKSHADEKLVPGKFNYDFGNKAIQIGARSQSDELSDIFIAERVFTGSSTIILASRGRIEVDEASEQVFLRLREGTIYAAAPGEPETFRTVDFGRLDYRLAFRSRGKPSFSRVKREPTLSVWEKIRPENSSSWLYWRLVVEFYTRLTLPWSCLAFSLAAIPMAIVDPRSGRSGSFLRAVFLILTYYIIWIAFKDLVKGGSAPPVVLWLPVILIGAYGLFRLWQVNSDFRFARWLLRR